MLGTTELPDNCPVRRRHTLAFEKSRLGCPHGRYDDKVVAAARSVGIKLVFTSDKRLNATRQGMLTPMRPLGRIGIAAEHIQAAPHRLDPAAAARWLWPRDCQ